LDGSGTVRDIGMASGPPVADPTGDRVSWMETAPAGDQKLVIYDTGTHERVATWQLTSAEEPSADTGGYVVAVEDETVTYSTADGVFRWSGNGVPRRVEFGGRSRLMDWRGDHVVANLGPQSDGHVTFGTTTSVDARPSPAATFAELSPDGRHAVGYFTAFSGREGWAVTLHSTSDGAAVPLEGIQGEPLMAGWTASGDLVVLSTEVPWGDLSADSHVTVSLCATDGQCWMPPDAPAGPIIDTLVQAGRIGPVLLYGMSGTSGEDSASSTSEETAPPAP
jgi:hypothetical protein